MGDFYIWPERMYKTLQWTKARGKKLVGYCWYHKKFMTIKQLKQHKCLKKHCDALERFEWHEFWNYRRERKK